MFYWPPAPGAVSYTITAGIDRLFSQTVFTAPVADTFFQPPADLPSDTIFWKVRSDLSTAYSSVDWFIIPADSIPFLYRYYGAQCTENQPAFRWKKVENASGYTIHLDSSGTFSTMLFNVQVPDTSFKPSIRLRNGVYFWRVGSSGNCASEVR